MNSLRWLPGRSLAGHIITRPSADPRKSNDRMRRDIGVHRDPVTFRNESVVVW